MYQYIINIPDKSVMGIKKLKTFLHTLCGGSGVYFHNTVSDFVKSEKYNFLQKKSHDNLTQLQKSNLKKQIDKKPYFLGIDASLYYCKYKRSFEKTEIGFLRQILTALSNGIVPVYVFDGMTPGQKNATIIQRRDKKQKARDQLLNLIKTTTGSDLSSLSINDLQNHIQNFINNDTLSDNSSVNVSNIDNYENIVKLSKKIININPTDIENIKKFLTALKIPYVTAKFEADDMMSKLYQNGVINACQSDDMDMLPKNCGNVVQISSNGVLQFVLSEILIKLNLTHTQFIDLCVLFGCDYYLLYTPRLKPIDLYDMYKSNGYSLDMFVDAYSRIDSRILDHREGYHLARDTFIENTEQVGVINLIISNIDFDKILLYFSQNNVVVDYSNMQKIQKMIKYANKSISLFN